MFNKALLYKNYKQAKFAIWAFWLVTLWITFKFNNHAQDVQYSFDHWKGGSNEEFNYYFAFANISSESMIQILLCVGMAVLMIGLARSNRSFDYSFSWPVRRVDLFLSAWLIGTVHIVAAVLVSTCLNFYILNNTILSEYVKHSALWYYHVHELFILIGVFSFSLFMGLICASVVSQFVVGFVSMYIPVVLSSLIYVFLDKHFGSYIFWGRRMLNDFMSVVSFPLRLYDIGSNMHLINSNQYVYIGYGGVYMALIVTVVSLLLIVRMAGKSINENNGKLLLYPKLEPVLRAGVILCAFLYGGAMFGSQISQSIFSYYAGGGFFTFIAWLILRNITGIKLIFGRK
ncbi:hypothetical protein [Paenibacillus sp. Soil522]|uniref:hypothetical protein n=1 Tax=Paenibacillus sp. Soil522 TaxID=1736388 RepID=UPI0006F9813B|nr:hypothetical protein [Paenibacillus sp. Soil522]KRE40937.1 hypothetical protein ASG81_17015 [Paenibacillus sp. Soil522]